MHFLHAFILMYNFQASYCLNNNGTMFWWHMEPYTFLTEDGRKAGILFEVLEKYSQYCGEGRREYSFQKSENYQHFLDKLESNFTIQYSDTSTADALQSTMWFPIISSNVAIQTNQMTRFEIFDSPGASVIVKRSSISLPVKMFTGVSNALILILTAFLCAVSIGIFTWLCVSQYVVYFSTVQANVILKSFTYVLYCGKRDIEGD